ncbi:hypothetical protein SK128_012468 [Halocaridina rubra]|uniref:Uncharacterized protein n=1 Tax=Halocaridina rubra TaxID=373956 RepID=A0AAN9A460_HALRR
MKISELLSDRCLTSLEIRKVMKKADKKAKNKKGIVPWVEFTKQVISEYKEGNSEVLLRNILKLIRIQIRQSQADNGMVPKNKAKVLLHALSGLITHINLEIEDSEVSVLDASRITSAILPAVIDLKVQVVKKDLSVAAEAIYRKVNLLFGHFPELIVDSILHCKTLVYTKFQEPKIFVPLLKLLFSSLPAQKTSLVKAPELYLKYLVLAKLLLSMTSRENVSNMRTYLVGILKKPPSAFKKWLTQNQIEWLRADALDTKSILNSIVISTALQTLYGKKNHLYPIIKKEKAGNEALELSCSKLEGDEREKPNQNPHVQESVKTNVVEKRTKLLVHSGSELDKDTCRKKQKNKGKNLDKTSKATRDRTAENADQHFLENKSTSSITRENSDTLNGESSSCDVEFSNELVEDDDNASVMKKNKLPLKTVRGGGGRENESNCEESSSMIEHVDVIGIGNDVTSSGQHTPASANDNGETVFKKTKKRKSRASDDMALLPSGNIVTENLSKKKKKKKMSSESSLDHEVNSDIERMEHSQLSSSPKCTPTEDTEIIAVPLKRKRKKNKKKKNLSNNVQATHEGNYMETATRELRDCENNIESEIIVKTSSSLSSNNENRNKSSATSAPKKKRKKKMKKSEELVEEPPSKRKKIDSSNSQSSRVEMKKIETHLENKTNVEIKSPEISNKGEGKLKKMGKTLLKESSDRSSEGKLENGGSVELCAAIQKTIDFSSVNTEKNCDEKRKKKIKKVNANMQVFESKGDWKDAKEDLTYETHVGENVETESKQGKKLKNKEKKKTKALVKKQNVQNSEVLSDRTPVLETSSISSFSTDVQVETAESITKEQQFESAGISKSGNEKTLDGNAEILEIKKEEILVELLHDASISKKKFVKKMLDIFLGDSEKNLKLKKIMFCKLVENIHQTDKKKAHKLKKLHNSAKLKEHIEISVNKPVKSLTAPGKQLGLFVENLSLKSVKDSSRRRRTLSTNFSISDLEPEKIRSAKNLTCNTSVKDSSLSELEVFKKTRSYSLSEVGSCNDSFQADVVISECQNNLATKSILHDNYDGSVNELGTETDRNRVCSVQSDASFIGRTENTINTKAKEAENRHKEQVNIDSNNIKIKDSSKENRCLELMEKVSDKVGMKDAIAESTENKHPELMVEDVNNTKLNDLKIESRYLGLADEDSDISVVYIAEKENTIHASESDVSERDEASGSEGDIIVCDEENSMFTKTEGKDYDRKINDENLINKQCNQFTKAIFTCTTHIEKNTAAEMNNCTASENVKEINFDDGSDGMDTDGDVKGLDIILDTIVKDTGRESSIEGLREELMSSRSKSAKRSRNKLPTDSESISQIEAKTPMCSNVLNGMEVKSTVREPKENIRLNEVKDANIKACLAESREKVLGNEADTKYEETILTLDSNYDAHKFLPTANTLAELQVQNNDQLEIPVCMESAQIKTEERSQSFSDTVTSRVDLTEQSVRGTGEVDTGSFCNTDISETDSSIAPSTVFLNCQYEAPEVQNKIDVNTDVVDELETNKKEELSQSPDDVNVTVTSDVEHDSSLKCLSLGDTFGHVSDSADRLCDNALECGSTGDTFHNVSDYVDRSLDEKIDVINDDKIEVNEKGDSVSLLGKENGMSEDTYMGKLALSDESPVSSCMSVRKITPAGESFESLSNEADEAYEASSDASEDSMPSGRRRMRSQRKLTQASRVSDVSDSDLSPVRRSLRSRRASDSRKKTCPTLSKCLINDNDTMDDIGKQASDSDDTNDRSSVAQLTSTCEVSVVNSQVMQTLSTDALGCVEGNIEQISTSEEIINEQTGAGKGSINSSTHIYNANLAEQGHTESKSLSLVNLTFAVSDDERLGKNKHCTSAVNGDKEPEEQSKLDYGLNPPSHLDSCQSRACVSDPENYCNSKYLLELKSLAYTGLQNILSMSAEDIGKKKSIDLEKSLILENRNGHVNVEEGDELEMSSGLDEDEEVAYNVSIGNGELCEGLDADKEIDVSIQSGMPKRHSTRQSAGRLNGKKFESLHDIVIPQVKAHCVSEAVLTKEILISPEVSDEEYELLSPNLLDEAVDSSRDLPLRINSPYWPNGRSGIKSPQKSVPEEQDESVPCSEPKPSQGSLDSADNKSTKVTPECSSCEKSTTTKLAETSSHKKNLSWKNNESQSLESNSKKNNRKSGESLQAGASKCGMTSTIKHESVGVNAHTVFSKVQEITLYSQGMPTTRVLRRNHGKSGKNYNSSDSKSDEEMESKTVLSVVSPVEQGIEYRCDGEPAASNVSVDTCKKLKKKVTVPATPSRKSTRLSQVVVDKNIVLPSSEEGVVLENERNKCVSSCEKISKVSQENAESISSNRESKDSFSSSTLLKTKKGDTFPTTLNSDRGREVSPSMCKSKLKCEATPSPPKTRSRRSVSSSADLTVPKCDVSSSKVKGRLSRSAHKNKFVLGKDNIVLSSDDKLSLLKTPMKYKADSAKTSPSCKISLEESELSSSSISSRRKSTVRTPAKKNDTTLSCSETPSNEELVISTRRLRQREVTYTRK